MDAFIGAIVTNLQNNNMQSTLNCGKSRQMYVKTDETLASGVSDFLNGITNSIPNSNQLTQYLTNFIGKDRMISVGKGLSIYYREDNSIYISHNKPIQDDINKVDSIRIFSDEYSTKSYIASSLSVRDAKLSFSPERIRIISECFQKSLNAMKISIDEPQKSR